ncbi:MAG TPA: TPM domain-containing protein, partial [Gemmatimonadales bacterium]|nr:TPM domain-containing protein [Gemmatimonadales bacterium]
MLRWRKATALLGLLQLLPLCLAAQSPAITRLFPAKPDGYLTDRAKLVDPATARQINDLAARLRQATGAELAVVTLPTIENQAPGDVALTI